MEVSGILSHVAYDCPTCIMLNLCERRNCTGGRLLETDFGMVIDPSDPPRIAPHITRPAYKNGWADVAVEAKSLGLKGFADAFSDKGSEYIEPLPYCIRHYMTDKVSIAWLRLYASISQGFRLPPSEAPDIYDSIMLGINAVVNAHTKAAHG